MKAAFSENTVVCQGDQNKHLAHSASKNVSEKKAVMFYYIIIIILYPPVHSLPMLFFPITHSQCGETRCYLPSRNNGQVFKYWLWLWKRHIYFNLTSGQGWTLTHCLLCLCSADPGCFPPTIWAWRSFSDRLSGGCIRDTLYKLTHSTEPGTQSAVPLWHEKRHTFTLSDCVVY